MGAFFDSSANPTTPGTSDLSWPHILGSLGSTGRIVVVVESENSSNNITGATFNGMAMTQIGSDGNNGSNGSFVKMFELYGVNVPPAGTYTVTVAFSAFDGSSNSRAAGSMAFGGITPQAAEAIASANANGTSPFSTNITTITSNALVVVGYGNQNSNVPTFSTGETKAFDSVPGSGELSVVTGAYKIVASPGSTSTSLTVSNPEAEALILAAFRVDISSPSASVSPSSSVSASPSPSVSPSVSPSSSVSASPSPSVSPSASVSPSSSESGSSSLSLSPSASPSPSPSEQILSVDLFKLLFPADYAEQYTLKGSKYTRKYVPVTETNID